MFTQQAPVRQETHDFRKVTSPLHSNRQNKSEADPIINELYENAFKDVILHQQYIHGIQNFCEKLLRYTNKQFTVQICNAIITKIKWLNRFLHKNHVQQIESHYPIPYGWNFLNLAGKQPLDSQRKKYTCSLTIETLFNEKVYQRIRANQKQIIKGLINTLANINLKQFLFLRKVSEFLEDAFQKLSNVSTSVIYDVLSKLIKLLTMWINSLDRESANQLRRQIGKSQLIFPIISFFQVCYLDKKNKQLFLISLQFFNQLIGDEGNRNIQTIFNQYFTNNSDSLQFFLKIKQILNEVNFQNRAQYKCKKLFDAINSYKQNVSLKKQSQFIVLKFLIALCKGNYKQNQIFLSSLSTISNFNIMSGIWEILKYQTEKYPQKIVNLDNYYLITQCFSTIRQLVQGPCQENQNQFLNREFFYTVKNYFQFQIHQNKGKIDQSLEKKINQITDVSKVFADNLQDYLYKDHITRQWMPSHVKYRSISLICSLLSENVTEKSKSQLSIISSQIIIREIDKVYERYVEMNLQYNYHNLEVHADQQVVLPLGFKLYELLQYYPIDKIPLDSPGYQFFKQNSRRVQVLHHKLCQVYFPRPPNSISEAFKNSFIQTADRTSVNSKLRDLQKSEIQNRQSDSYYGPILLLVVLALVICDFVLYNSITLPFVYHFNFYPIFQTYDTADITVVASRIVFIVLSMVLSIIYLFLEIKGAIYMQQTINHILQLQIPWWFKLKQLIQLFYNNMSYMHYFWTLIFSILGIFNPIFDCLLFAVQLYRRSQTFALIINAIKSTLDQLAVVLLLTFICTYILTSIIYYYFAQSSYPTECETLYYCLVFSLDIGFKADAGIVGYTDGDTILTDFLSKNIIDVSIDFVYLFIIKLVLAEVIGAIMVDKFAQMRQQKQKLKEDEDSKCFICGLERSLLDREQDGFDKHKRDYHNVWSYLQFLIYLRNSKLSNLSGVELFVHQQQTNDKLKWFPINRSLNLQKKKQQQQQYIEGVKQDEIERLSKVVDSQIGNLKSNINQIWELINLKIAKQNNMSLQ